MSFLFALYFVWPSWLFLLLVSAGVFSSPMMATIVVAFLRRAKFLAERPRSPGSVVEPVEPAVQPIPEVRAKAPSETRTARREWPGTMLGISQALVAWVEATTSTGKPTSRAHYGLYDFCHEERFALVATCEKALEGFLPREEDAPPAQVALSALAESIRDLAAVVFEDGIGPFDAAAVTLECDAEFGAACRDVVRRAASASAALAGAQSPKVERTAMAELRTAFESLENHDPYAALPHFHKAVDAWQDAKE
jgi:hypothetical protein